MRLFELPDGVFINPEHIVFLGASEAPHPEDGRTQGVVVISTLKEHRTLHCETLDEAQHLLRRLVSDLRSHPNDAHV